MTDTIYRENILDHFRNPRNFGPLTGADASHTEANELCGDRIEMQVKYATDKGKQTIDEIKFQGEGCAIAVASASLLTDHVKGKSVTEVRTMDAGNITKLLGIPLTPSRLKCALLSLEALHKTLDLVKNSSK
jgi:nitrogen fixation NifU-like protein